MAAFLIVQRGEDIGRRFDLDTTQLTVGRGSDNDMVLNDPMVSRYHAVVKRQGNGHLVIDLGSSNPVVINDQVCEPGEPRVLQHRDVVFIGKTVFSFQNRGAGPGAQTGSRQQGSMSSTQFSTPTPEFDPPTPPPPSRQPASAMPEARATPPPPKADPATSPAMPVMPTPPPAAPSFADRDDSNDDRTMVAGLGRPAEPAIMPFTPPPPPPAAGLRGIDDDSTRPTPGLPPMGIGAPPPPPPPPAFAPPKPPQMGGPGDDNEGDMQTQIVPRR